MANRAYLHVWTRDFTEATLIAQLARFLATAPLSTTRPTFTELTVQPIDATETPVASWDLRPLKYGAAEVAALAIQQLNFDSAYQVAGKWDLWDLNTETLKWTHQPEPLLLTCQGLDYDGGVASTDGNFAVDLGFEHFFTGHAGLLAPAAASNPFD